MLKHVSGCMQEIFQRQIVGRIGGDEFLILVEDFEGDAALKSLVEEFYQKLAESQEPVKVTCSIGVALCGEEEVSFKELFQRADQALCEAKKGGKGRCVIWERG